MTPNTVIGWAVAVAVVVVVVFLVVFLVDVLDDETNEVSYAPYAWEVAG